MLPFVLRSVAKRLPELSLEALHSYVTKELYPTLLETRARLNKLLEMRNVVGSSSKAWDPPLLAALAQTTTTVAVLGAPFGDEVTASFSLPLQDMTLSGSVSAADVVTVVLFNGTAGALDLASGTLRASVARSTDS